MKYSDFAKYEMVILDYYEKLAEIAKLKIKIEELSKEIENLKRKNYGLKQTIKNYKEKDEKRYNLMSGKVFDKDPYKGRFR